jgi:hypothetical protein
LNVNPKITPFAQLLAGIKYSGDFEETTLAIQPGFAAR